MPKARVIALVLDEEFNLICVQVDAVALRALVNPHVLEGLFLHFAAALGAAHPVRSTRGVALLLTTSLIEFGAKRCELLRLDLFEHAIFHVIADVIVDSLHGTTRLNAERAAAALLRMRLIRAALSPHRGAGARSGSKRNWKIGRFDRPLSRAQTVQARSPRSRPQHR
jgi:hypothetical protein